MQHYGFFSFLSKSAMDSVHRIPERVASQSIRISGTYGTMLTSIIGMVIAVPLAVGAALVITRSPQRGQGSPLRTGGPPRRSSQCHLRLLGKSSAAHSGHQARRGFPRHELSAYCSCDRDRPCGSLFSDLVLRRRAYACDHGAPIIAAVFSEVFRSTPRNEKEAALALGATRWGMHPDSGAPEGALRHCRSVTVGSWPSLGETIAVTMVIGNAVLHINASIFSQGATMSSVIANEVHGGHRAVSSLGTVRGRILAPDRRIGCERPCSPRRDAGSRCDPNSPPERPGSTNRPHQAGGARQKRSACRRADDDHRRRSAHLGARLRRDPGCCCAEPRIPDAEPSRQPHPPVVGSTTASPAA